MTPSVTKGLVQKILEHPHDHDWVASGLGFMKLHLNRSDRLHVWDSILGVDGAWKIHDHAWDFKSTVIVGEITDHKYQIINMGAQTTHYKYVINCGTGELIDEGGRIFLEEFFHPDTIIEGQWYNHAATDLHSSEALNGTVTIIERMAQQERSQATVYGLELPFGMAGEWKPSKSQIDAVCDYAYHIWFR